MDELDFEDYINYLFFAGSISNAQSESFDKKSFIETYDTVSFNKFLTELGFYGTYLLLTPYTIYTENRDLINFIKSNNIPIKIYDNFSTEMVEVWIPPYW